MSVHVTGFVVTFNQERRLRAVPAGRKFLAQLLVADRGSQDSSRHLLT